MYNKFFGFKEKPFKLVPNPEYLFLSKSHEEALAHLAYAISQGEGFVELTGEVGTGKTTLCRVFLENLDKSTEAAYIFNPKLDALQLLKAINDELGIDSTPDNTKDLIDRLNEFLIRKKGAGQQVLVLIDEAQNLSLEVLEQLRLLSNLETTREKLLQIILVGQPELGDMLSSHQLRQLGQRITINCRLSPLTYDETRDYIRHRIALASHRAGPPFDKASYRAIYEYSRGIPRLINIACDRALLNAFSRSSHKITAPIAREAISELTRKKPVVSRNRLHAPAGLLIAAAVFVPLMLLLFYFGTGKSPKFPDFNRPSPPEQLAQADSGQTLPGEEQGAEPVVMPAESMPVQGQEPIPAQEKNPSPEQPGESGGPAAPPAGPKADMSTADRDTLLPDSPAADEDAGSLNAAAAEVPAAAAAPVAQPDQESDVMQPRQNGMDSQTFLNFLQGLNSRISRNSAVAEILRLWLPAEGIVIQQNITNSDRIFFQDAVNPYDLQVQPVATASDLSLLQTLNLPAIFTFYPPGHGWPKYLAVAAIDQDTIHFFTGDQDKTAAVDRETFLRNWSGEAYIVWKNFKDLNGVIGLRSRGEDVTALKRLLLQLGYTGISLTEKYDRETLQIIKSVQTKYGLQIDGLVGPFTKIALYNESSELKKPSLMDDTAARPENGT